jgi:hypothetical protein
VVDVDEPIDLLGIALFIDHEGFHFSAVDGEETPPMPIFTGSSDIRWG